MFQLRGPKAIRLAVLVYLILSCSALLAAPGSLQGSIVDLNGNPLVLPGAAVVIQNISTQQLSFVEATPNFYTLLEEGDYLIRFDVPGQSISFSTCGNCVTHTQDSFRPGGSFLVRISAHSFVDLHFKVSLEQRINQVRNQNQLPSSYTGGLLRVLDCSIPGVCAQNLTPLAIDSAGTLARFSYAYAPSIVSENGVDHVFYCSHGEANAGYDYIRRFSSRSMNIEIAVKSTGSRQLDLAACDPSIVFFEGYYYMFYSSSIQTNLPGEPYFQQNVLQVARASRLDGEWLTFTQRETWEATPSDPKIILGPQVRRSSPRSVEEIGLAWPSAVVRDGEIHLWFVDDSVLEANQFQAQSRPYFYLKSRIPTFWHRPSAQRTSLSQIHSAEIKFDPVVGQFALFEIAQAHTQGAFAQVRFSRDGLNWSQTRPLTGPMEGAHNIGVKGDQSGWLLRDQTLQIMFGLPWGGRPKSQDVWTEWDLYTTQVIPR